MLISAFQVLVLKCTYKGRREPGVSDKELLFHRLQASDVTFIRNVSEFTIRTDDFLLRITKVHPALNQLISVLEFLICFESDHLDGNGKGFSPLLCLDIKS